MSWKNPELQEFYESHPDLTLTECMIELKKAKKKNKRGGSVGAAGIIEAGASAVDALGNAAKNIGDAVDQGRRTTQEIRENTGKNDYIREVNQNRANTEDMLAFERYLDKLSDARYGNQGMVPEYLKFSKFRLPANLTNRLPRFRDRLEKADTALLKYAREKWYEKYGYYP